MVNDLGVAASLHVHGLDYDTASDGDGAMMNNSVVEPGAAGRTCGAPTLCRSKSRRRTSGGLSVLVDDTAEDAGAQESAAVEVMHGDGLLVGVGW